ncbi:hypothetical protein WMY93_034328, partial [Mugilogobius chulae]
RRGGRRERRPDPGPASGSLRRGSAGPGDAEDVGTRTQTGLEIVERILDPEKSPGLEQDQSDMDRLVDTVVCSWVNSTNFKVVLLGMDILSPLSFSLSSLSLRGSSGDGHSLCSGHSAAGSLQDSSGHSSAQPHHRLGDAKDQVRDQDQALLLKIMDQAANPQFVWERMMGGFKHKNSRTREGLCLLPHRHAQCVSDSSSSPQTPPFRLRLLPLPMRLLPPKLTL